MLRIVEREDFPFGPFMLVGALVGLVLGDSWRAVSSARDQRCGHGRMGDCSHVALADRG